MTDDSSRKPGANLSRDALGEIFDSHEEAVEVLDLLPRYLKDRFGRTKDRADGGFGFFGIERIRVEFSHKVKGVEIENSYASNTATIFAPALKGESPKSREERRKALLSYYLPCMTDSQERATAQFYELLKRSGRTRLMQELKRKYKKKKKRA